MSIPFYPGGKQRSEKAGAPQGHTAQLGFKAGLKTQAN